MFKLESYITPILFSYVDKYIKNFRPEDSQVSLWGGDASFHNLDLRLEVLEQELQLPFSFVSGHIHELLIHVPWTKLVSEPITITINTIECILKLRGAEGGGGGESDTSSQQAKEKQKRSIKNKEEIEAPPGYVQSLINKIVSNIRIYCNNLILKYVEEDIVLSMNVKLLSFESANEKWEAAYTELSATQVVLRKLITLNDLTLCLDKRNAAGKIDVYQEPMLYRCSLTMHLLRNYHSATAKKASTTRLHIYCNKMEFSMTEQQVPMLMRLLQLAMALQAKEFKIETENPIESASSHHESIEHPENQESWAGWAWSFVPSILPSAWDEDWSREQEGTVSGHIVHIGFYVDSATVTFKVSETSGDRAYYSQRKVKYIPLLALHVQGVYVEVLMHGIKWFNATVGVSEAVMVPVGCCSCSFKEVQEGAATAVYLTSGSASNLHKADSLFDANAPENIGRKRNYNISWDFHLFTVTESTLLERTPAFALDYVYKLEIPDDMTSERLSEVGSDLEYSNLSESSLLRLAIGPFRLGLSSGFFHRIGSLLVAASAFDYPPYSVPKPDPQLWELSPPSAEDFDALNECIPTKTVQITLLAPIVEFQLMDHPHFTPMKGNLYRKMKKAYTSNQMKDLPKLTLECQCLDIKIVDPMYLKRLIYTTCKLPDPPKNMFDACYSNVNLKMSGFCSRLILPLNRHTTIITPSSFSFCHKSIYKPIYWINPDIPHCESVFESESITFTGTKAKTLLALNIIDKLIKMDVDDAVDTVMNTSLMEDAARDFGFPYLELVVEGLRFKRVTTNTTVSIDASLDSIKSFVFDPYEFLMDTSLAETESYAHFSGELSVSDSYLTPAFTSSFLREIQQVLIISGPEPSSEKQNSEETPLLTVTVQYPLLPDVQPHPPIFLFKLREVKLCFDPLLCHWLVYTPRNVAQRSESVDPLYQKTRNILVSAGITVEPPKRAGTPHESIHSSSEREYIYPTPRPIKIIKENDTIDFQDWLFDLLKKWFAVWKGMLICGEIAHCTLYFPVASLSAVGLQGIQETVENAMGKTDKPEILIIVLPKLCFKSAQRQTINQAQLKLMPVKLSDAVWSSEKLSFPWSITVTDFTCYTMQHGHTLTFLKPVSLSATIGLSTRNKQQTDIPTTTTPKLNPHETTETTTTTPTIGSLGVCIHVDMSPITISISEVQVCLMASILYGLLSIFEQLAPDLKQQELMKSSQEAAMTTPPPIVVKTPILQKDTISTHDSTSEQSNPQENQQTTTTTTTDNVKLTAWIQWTIARFTMKVYTQKFDLLTDFSYIEAPSMLLVLDAEDIVSSLDFQSVYLKIKSKIGTATIKHYERVDGKWMAGAFRGLVMTPVEEEEAAAAERRQEDTSFFSVTITRASCQHTHTLWGANRNKAKLKEKKERESFETTPSNYITEVVINLQPVDFVISLATLRNFYMVVEPILNLDINEETPTEQTTDQNLLLLKFNNQTLPLAYLECKRIRFIMPSVELGGSGISHDVCMFQVERISLNPNAVNPICRTPCRPDIYQQAAQARILNIPGSEVEDRQYQLDVIGMEMNTGIWEELDPLLSRGTSYATTLRTMNENPALEWNNLEKSRLSLSENLDLLSMVSKFDVTVVAAPALVYKKDVVVCGHSIEVNFVTNIEVSQSLDQIQLASALISEFLRIFEPFYSDIIISKRPKITVPYQWTIPDVKESTDNTAVDAAPDSGFETADFRSSSAYARDVHVQRTYAIKTSESDKVTTFPRPPHPLHPQPVPIELLFTGGKITVILYQSATQSRDKRKVVSTRDIVASKHESDHETGYEASEEGSTDEHASSTVKRYQPLLYFSICEPNAYLSRQQLSRTIQISFFNIDIRISDTKHYIRRALPCERDFTIHLLETKSGQPHPDTGILPAFFTAKWVLGLGKPSSLDVNIAKPVKVFFSMARWNRLMYIKEKVLGNLKSPLDESVSIFERLSSMTRRSEGSSLQGRVVVTKRQREQYTNFDTIKRQLSGISNLNIKLAQTVFLFKMNHGGEEVHLCFARLKSHLYICNRPERLTNVATLESLTLTVNSDGYQRLLLNPWTISLEVCLFWESWQLHDSNPQIHVTGESDCFVLDISPEQIKCVELLVGELNEFLASNFLSDDDDDDDKQSCNDTINTFIVEQKDQYYKDDLRAGAFQFVDAATSNADELPLPYQVMFWNQNVSAMAWRYPQPRALTKVRVFPVPFQVATDSSQTNRKLYGNLEYWSDCQATYLPYVQFALSESEITHLTLPESQPMPVVATTWRVVLNSNYDSSSSSSSSTMVISSRALAACMRIDSYFNANLVPLVNFAMQITKITVSLYNNFNKTINNSTQIKPFVCDMVFPQTQCFLTLNIDNIRSFVTVWNRHVATADVHSTIQCNVLDYTYLTQQDFIEPFTSKLQMSISNRVNLNFISKPIHLKFGPCIAHTFAVSAQNWANPTDLVIMTHYVICNDTNLILSFGQTGTDEDHTLLTRQCHLYSWRSQKSKQMLKIGLEEKTKIWSKPFSIDIEGNQICVISHENNTALVVTVKNLSATQKQVVFSGQLIFSNMLLEHFEVKIVRALSEDREREFKQAPKYIVNGQSTPPSLLLNVMEKYFLRLRFFGLESAWSGDIPLLENTKCAQPWLVKVPLQERGQFLSVWCKVVVQDLQGGRKFLVMFWPLFMVRSNLPVNSKVHIETPTLGVHLESVVKGRGEFQQLYCPGTIDHSHQLTFQLDGGTPATNPYVPLNYSLVDQKKFFKKFENEDINTILSVLETFRESKWPYFGDELDEIDWITEDQPLTHVQVRYQNACQYSSALLVELLPWCLLVNTLGCPIALIVNEKELCRVSHHGIVTPPKLEETFHLGVGIGGTWNISNPLQLAKSDWSQAFYMPKIIGTIPLEGTIKTAVTCGSHICMVSINSSVSNETRLLKVSSTHVITNFMSTKLQVMCMAVPDVENIYCIPNDLDMHSFTIEPHLDESKAGVSILQWYTIDNETDNTNTTDYALYVAFATNPKFGWSCPVRVDKNLVRRSLFVKTENVSLPFVITSHEYRGQTFLTIHHDSHPQLLIENRCGTKFYCAQIASNENGALVMDCQHFKWLCAVDMDSACYYTMPGISEKFPDIAPNGYPDQIALSIDPEVDPKNSPWSTPLSITNYNEQFIRIPYYGEVRVLVIDAVRTILIIVEAVSQVEISARDIRVRLTMRDTDESSHMILEYKAPSVEKLPTDVSTITLPTTTTATTHYQSAHEVTATGEKTVSETALVAFSLPPLAEKSNLEMLNIPLELKRHWSDLDVSRSVSKSLHQISTIPLRNEWSSLNVNVFVKSLNVVFTLDLEEGGIERTEIANFTCNDFAVTALQKESMEVCLTLSDIQFDNQLYSRASYDFPVVFVGQETRPYQPMLTLNADVLQSINHSREKALLTVNFTVETWVDVAMDKQVTDLESIKINIEPLSLFIEDTYITKLLDYLKIFTPTKLILWPKQKPLIKYDLYSSLIGIPDIIMWESLLLSKPLTLKNFSIEPVSVTLSIHSSVKLYIALDKSPLHFGKFERKRVLTTPYRLGHALTMHYLSGAIFGAGWVVGSLELLGSPGGLARAMGTGLRDFVSLPYQGLVQGPWAFLRGVTHGSASLMRHVTAGTLESVTKLASSVARNLDRLTLDEEHLRRTEEQRRMRPQGVTQGFIQGLTGLGISLLGAVGGIAHHPLQSVMADGASPRSLAAGVGLGLVGVFTKPLSGAAELVALTGQGLLQGAGWNPLPQPRIKPTLHHIYSANNSVLKYTWKIIPTAATTDILFVTDATIISNTCQYEAVALILTAEALIIVNTDEDVISRVLALTELIASNNASDPTLLSLKLIKDDGGSPVEMDPACRARVADYVRNTVGLLQQQQQQQTNDDDDLSPDHSEMSVSPLLTPTGAATAADGTAGHEQLLSFYLNPQNRNYFLSMLGLAKQQRENYCFHVL